MTQTPKNPPSWLSGGDNQPPPSEPEDSGANAGADEDVPPWLRAEETPPEPPRVRRVTPPPQEEGEGELPPWLAGADEPAKPKSYKIGGTELSEEYFATADELPDTVESEMTFDSWMAEQEEAKREKDIEEEIPDDLISSIGSDTSPLKQTGQLPDWFLGLEALDTTEAPEWFSTEDEAQKRAEAVPPTWINDMLDEAPAVGQVSDEEDELPSAEDIGSLFSSLSSTATNEGEAPDIDWYDQVDQNEQNEQTSYAPDDDFFTQLVGGSTPSSAASQPDYGSFGAYDDDTSAEAPAQGAVEIPQNELDAFFDNLASTSGRGQQPISLDDIEDPDLEWVVPTEAVVEPEPELFTPEEPEMPAASAEDNADWLGELETIVAGASRLPPTGAQTRLLDDDYTAGFADENSAEAWDAAPADASAADTGDFQWPAPETPVEAVPEAAAEADWLSALEPTADAVDETFDSPPEETALPELPSMMARLNREPEAPQAEEVDDWESLVGATLLDDEQPVESQQDEVDELFSREALLAAGGLLAAGALLGNDEQEASDQPDEIDLFAEPAAEAPASGLFDTEQDETIIASRDEFTAEAPASAVDDAMLAEELQSGWMSDDLLEEEEAVAPTEAASDADFFTMLESDADANLLDEQQPEQWGAEQALAEAAFLNALDSELPGAAPETAAQEDDDFFATLGLGDEDEEQAGETAAQEDDFYPALDFGAEDEAQPAGLPNTSELIGQWADEAVAQEDDFASMSVGDDEPVGLPNTGDLIAQWDDEEQPAAQEGEFFSVLDIGTGELNAPDAEAEQDEAFTQWQVEPTADDETLIAQQDDLYASLGITEDDEEQPAGLSNTGELLGALAVAAQLDETAVPEDDYIASLDYEPENVADQLAGLPNTSELISQWDDEAQPTETVGQEDDFFASLGISEDGEELPAGLPNTGDLISSWDDAPPTEGEAETVPDDFFASLGMDGEVEAQPAAETDPFADWGDTQAAVPPTADFYAALDMVEGEQAEEIPDFFANLSEPQAGQAQAFDDVDSYLASLSSDSLTVDSETPFAQDAELDLDSLFADQVIDSPAGAAPNPDFIPGADEDWLAQLGTSVDEVSASAIVRQKEDRPVEELSDRLKKLRASADDIPDEVLASDDNSMSPSPFVGSAGMATAVTLSAEQEKQVDALKELVPANERAQPTRFSAIDATYDSPFMPELEDTSETTVHPVKKPAPPKQKKQKKQGGGRRIRLDRLLVGLLLAAALILPFILPSLRVGNLPPAEFAAGSAAQAAFDEIDGLQSGELALVGVEYGAASAGELDPMTDAMLRHILLRGAYPVIISSNPIGLMRAETRLEEISQDTEFLERIGANGPLQENVDYYVVRFLPGNAIGLRALSGDTANVMLSDIRGQATNLDVNSLQDFGLVSVITDRADDLRTYAEQIAPYTNAPLVPAVSYGAAPLSEPYAQSLGGGLLVGFTDALSYTDLLDTVEARNITQRTRVVPTRDPAAVGAQGAQTQQATPRSTSNPATAIPTPTPAPSIAIVISDQPANVRGGAGTEFPVLAVALSGERLIVLGFNDNGSWVNVQLEDGREGWISSALVSIEEERTSAPKADIFAKRQQVDEGDGEQPPTATRVPSTVTVSEPETEETAVSVTEAAVSPTSTPRPSRTPVPSATPTPTEAPAAEATEEVTPEATAEVTDQPVPAAPLTFTLPPASPGYREERWYALNVGIIASALIITAGMVINLVRGLARRGQRG